jgi:hypothetical protein
VYSQPGSAKDITLIAPVSLLPLLEIGRCYFLPTVQFPRGYIVASSASPIQAVYFTAETQLELEFPCPSKPFEIPITTDQATLSAYSSCNPSPSQLSLTSYLRVKSEPEICSFSCRIISAVRLTRAFKQRYWGAEILEGVLLEVRICLSVV